MSIKKVLYVLIISAEVMTLSACSSEGAPNVITGPSTPVESPPATLPTAPAHYKGFIWSPESGLQVIPQPSYAESMYPSAINNHGQVIGRLLLHDGKEDTRGFIWSANDGLQRIGSLIGPEGVSWPLTIDDNGEVRGLSEGPLTTYFLAIHLEDAFVWTAAEGIRATAATRPDGGRSFNLPYGADCMQLVKTTSNGISVGYGGTMGARGCTKWVALMWEPDGTPVEISQCEPRCVTVNDINNHGEVVGWVDGAFKWTRSGGFVPFPVDGGWLSFINDNGDAVGYIPGDLVLKPTIWTASGQIRTVDLPKGTTSLHLVGINERSEVIGTFQ